jgi:hypothetical protein
MTMIRLPRRGREGSDRRPLAAPTDCVRACATHALTPRVEDLDAWWSAHAHRALALLPADLHWARPLLDPLRPVPLLCSREQARLLIAWHERLPTAAQVSFATTKRDRDDPPPLCA